VYLCVCVCVLCVCMCVHVYVNVYTNANCVGQAITLNIQCIYGNIGRDITKYTVIYGVYIWFWPNLQSWPHERKNKGSVSLSNGSVNKW